MAEKRRKYLNRIIKGDATTQLTKPIQRRKRNVDDGECKEKVFGRTTLIELNSGMDHSDTRKTIILHRFPLQPSRAEKTRFE
jgi:hypothetical protein